MTEVRTLPVFGTFYREHSIWVDGEKVHAQLSPYAANEITERVARYKHPSSVRPIKSTSYHSKAGPKAKKYEWRTGVNED